MDRLTRSSDTLVVLIIEANVMLSIDSLSVIVLLVATGETVLEISLTDSVMVESLSSIVVIGVLTIFDLVSDMSGKVDTTMLSTDSLSVIVLIVTVRETIFEIPLTDSLDEGTFVIMLVGVLTIFGLVSDIVVFVDTIMLSTDSLSVIVLIAAVGETILEIPLNDSLDATVSVLAVVRMLLLRIGVSSVIDEGTFVIVLTIFGLVSDMVGFVDTNMLSTDSLSVIGLIVSVGEIILEISLTDSLDATVSVLAVV